MLNRFVNSNNIGYNVSYLKLNTLFVYYTNLAKISSK